MRPLALALSAALLSACQEPTAPTGETNAPVPNFAGAATKADRIPGQYIVVFQKDAGDVQRKPATWPSSIGESSRSSGFTVRRSLVAYNPPTNTWETRPSLSAPRASLGAAALMDLAIHAVGGRKGSNVLAITETYRP